MNTRELPAPTSPDASRPSGHCGKCGREITKRDALWIVGDELACSQECSDAIWATHRYNPDRIEPADPFNNNSEQLRSRMPANPFSDIAPHQPSSETSKASAEVAGRSSRSKMFRIYEFLREQGLYGATRSEIVDALGIPLQTVCGRIRRLYQMGRAGSNCVQGCFVACGHHPVTRINRHSGVENEVMLHEDYVRRWQQDQSRPAEHLSWEK